MLVNAANKLQAELPCDIDVGVSQFVIGERRQYCASLAIRLDKFGAKEIGRAHV